MLKMKKITKIDKNYKKSKTGYDLMKHVGVLKGDKEYEIIQKELKVGWRKWTRKYIK